MDLLRMENKEDRQLIEIERKFLIHKDALPLNLETYPHKELEQAYIITEPVLRVRRKNEEYILTYKGTGLMKREEVEFSLPKDAYETLRSKAEGNIITKTRYFIPEKNALTIELDIFHGQFEGLYLAEVEFTDEESASAYIPPDWFGKEVTNENTFHNSTLSKLDDAAIKRLVSSL